MYDDVIHTAPMWLIIAGVTVIVVVVCVAVAVLVLFASGV